MPLACVVNVSEGRRDDVLAEIVGAAGPHILDVHVDPHHNRAVLTLAGEDGARAVARAAVRLVDLRQHRGVHPRLGAVDVVPFVPVRSTDLAEAVAAREGFATWAAAELGVPCFLYGPERSLPDVRRTAFVGLVPDTGPSAPHPTAGACAVGARLPLVAYNLWLVKPDLDLARRLAGELRGPAVRALGLAVGGDVQVSMNLIDPAMVGPADVYDRVAAVTAIARAELVGLVPEAVLAATSHERWGQLDLSADRELESRF